MKIKKLKSDYYNTNSINKCYDILTKIDMTDKKILINIFNMKILITGAMDILLASILTLAIKYPKSKIIGIDNQFRRKWLEIVILL